MTHGRGYVKIKPADPIIDKDILKEVIDGNVQSLMMNVVNLVYSSEMKSIINIWKKTLELRDVLKKALQVYLNRVTLSGYCNYISS